MCHCASVLFFSVDVEFLASLDNQQERLLTHPCDCCVIAVIVHLQYLLILLLYININIFNNTYIKIYIKR